jgi:two-component sensor histidine kinase
LRTTRTGLNFTIRRALDRRPPRVLSLSALRRYGVRTNMRLPSRLTHSRAVLLATLAGLLAITDDFIEWWWHGTPVELVWADAIAGVGVFLLTLFAAVMVVRPEREERRRRRAIQEVHHHVRNALQVVRLHEQLGADPSTRAYVDEAIERIEWVMREVLPAVGAPDGTDVSDSTQRAAD